MIDGINSSVPNHCTIHICKFYHRIFYIARKKTVAFDVTGSGVSFASKDLFAKMEYSVDR